MTNCNHDLIHALSEKLDSVWRYDDYIKNAQAEACAECVDLWKDLKKRDQEICQIIQNRIIAQIQQNKFK